MAKPNSQAGHGPFSGAADESTLPDGETSRRGADGGPDGPKSDWGIPDATDESKLSRILGLILVLVLVGVFSFVAYRKYNDARLHPLTDPSADTASSPAGSNQAAVANTIASNGAPGESPVPNRPADTNGTSASAFQQLDDTSNPNAAFHPTGSRGGAGQSAERNPAEQQAKPSQTASHEAEVNPFNDVATNTPEPNGAAARTAQPDANRATAAVSKPGTDDLRSGQSEPLFNEGNAQQSPNQPAGHVHSMADGSTPNGAPNPPGPNQDGGLDSMNRPTNSQNAGQSGRANAAQLQPVRGEQGGLNGQIARAPNPPSQTEPPTNNLLEESPKPVPAVRNDVARNHQEAAPDETAQFHPRAATGGRLDLEEPLPTGGSREPGRNLAGSAGPDRGAEASSSTTVQTSPAPNPPARNSDNEDLFATKTVDSKSGGDPSTIPPRHSSAFAPATGGPGGTDTALNEAGDSYVVQPQDTFWTISRKKYGTARYFRALAELNKAHVPDPTRMRPGVKVSTPPTEILETRFAQYLPKGSAVEVASGERQAGKFGPTGFFTNAEGRPMYRTGEKDTLSDIAARHLGRASRWIQIFEMNRDKLATPNQLKIGTELALPGDASNVAVTDDIAVRR